MKFFVTDAQLATMRSQIEDTVRAQCSDLIMVFERKATAEIERQRADRTAELARVVDPSAPFVAHLKDEVAFWRLQFLKERQRAEIAIDACRVQHQGVAAVAMDLRPQGEGGVLMSAQMGNVRDQFSDPELAGMGLTEGVG